MFFKIVVLKICNIYRKTPVLGSLFNKVAGLRSGNFLKNSLQHRCSCGYCKIFNLAWFDSSSAFYFRICVGKTLIAFDFDEKLKQGDAQVTMWYHVSKDFLPLHFAVGQVLSISGYNLENGTRQWKSWFWFCSAFVNFADIKMLYFASCLCCSCKLF